MSYEKIEVMKVSGNQNGHDTNGLIRSATVSLGVIEFPIPLVSLSDDSEQRQKRVLKF